MPMNDTIAVIYQKMARQCGFWATARCMRKRQYTLEQCRVVLFGVRHCRRVWSRSTDPDRIAA